MSRPTRVRVAFELTREEAAMLRLYAIDIHRPGAGKRDLLALTVVHKLRAALERGIARYDTRTKGEVGDGND